MPDAELDYVIPKHERVTPRSARPTAAVALRIAALGTTAGALTGVISVIAWIALFARDFIGVLPTAMLVAGAIGGLLGGVLFPLVGFTFLRRIPIGRILLAAILGAAVGGVLGVQYLEMWLLGPLLGFLTAIALLFFSARSAGPQVSHSERPARIHPSA